MTMLLTSQGMAAWPPAKTWDSSRVGGTCRAFETQVSPDEEVHESRVQTTGRASTRNPTLVRSPIKALVMLVAFPLLLVSSPVRVHDEAEVSFQTFSDQLGAHTGNYAPNISTSERLYESLGSRFESLSRPSGDAFARPNLSGYVSAPVWVDGAALATFSSTTEFKVSNTYDSLDSDYDHSEERIEKMAPTVKIETHLARLTAYWPEEGDHYTKRRLSSSGVQLRDGHCAVDPKVIPYGSVVKIPGMGQYVAVDTGPAVVSRRAARQAGRTSHERNALVVDVYCSSRSKAEVFEANAPDFAVITWYR